MKLWEEKLCHLLYTIFLMCLDFYSEIDFDTRILFLDKYFVIWSKRNFVVCFIYIYIYISYVFGFLFREDRFWCKRNFISFIIYIFFMCLDFYSERINFENSVLFSDKYFITWSKKNFVIHHYIFLMYLDFYLERIDFDARETLFHLLYIYISYVFGFLFRNRFWHTYSLLG